MISAVILDIDGVLVGEREGYNFPEPHSMVLEALKQIHERGVDIVLCTGKPYYSITKIIEKSRLNDPHITNGGSLIVNPLDKSIVKKYPLEKTLAQSVTEYFLSHNVYTEVYTADDYFIQKDQLSEITEKHVRVLEHAPKLVGSLTTLIDKEEPIRIMLIANDADDKKRVNELFSTFNDEATISWGIHPSIMPLQFGMVTGKGISKRRAAQDVIEYLNLSFDTVLGVGDGENDWQFIELCRYKVAMGNASDRLKQLVAESSTTDSFIAPDVNENGILHVFERFSL